MPDIIPLWYSLYSIPTSITHTPAEIAQFHLLIATELNERIASSLLPVVVALVTIPTVLASFKTDNAFLTGETVLIAYYNFGTCLIPFAPINIIFAVFLKFFY